MTMYAFLAGLLRLFFLLRVDTATGFVYHPSRCNATPPKSRVSSSSSSSFSKQQQRPCTTFFSHNNNNNNHNNNDNINNNDDDLLQVLSKELKTTAAAVLLGGEEEEQAESSSPSTPTTTSATTTDSPAALKSLELLLKRQTADIEETKRLIDLVKTAATAEQQQQDNPTHLLNEKNHNNKETLSKSLSAATSVLYGFDYGFVSRSEGATNKGTTVLPELELQYGRTYGGPPGSLLRIGSEQFVRNWRAIQGEYRDEEDAMLLTLEQRKYQDKLEELTLNTTEIWAREFADGPIEAPLIIKIPYLAVCFLLDVVFEGRYVPSRFFLLETVARMPYFSYITMLHLYETLGFWRRSAEMKRIHFAEELNEFRHLLIMESLGGDQSWWVRFVAQHSAIVYYVVLCLLWAVSPSLSYRFSELLETHAVNTYGVFLDDNEQELKQLPPSLAAVDYYCFGASDPFYAEFQTSALAEGEDIRRPGDNLKSLYDVFSAIRADERDHVATMNACLDPEATLTSPSLEKRLLTGASLTSIAYFLAASSLSGGGVDPNSALVGADLATATAAASGDASLVESVMAGLSEAVDGLADGGAGGGAETIVEGGAVILETVRRGLIAILETIGGRFFIL